VVAAEAAPIDPDAPVVEVIPDMIYTLDPLTGAWSGSTVELQ